MMGNDIEADIAAFVRAAIPSVWTLEVLMLMARASERAFTVDQVNRELRASPNIVRAALHHLQISGLLAAQEDGLFRYRPASEHLDGLVRRVEVAHKRTPLALLQVIAARPESSVRQLADAFRLRKN